MMSQSSKGRSFLKSCTGDTFLLLLGSCISTAKLSSSNFEVMLSDIVCKENDYFILCTMLFETGKKYNPIYLKLCILYRIASILHVFMFNLNVSILNVVIRLQIYSTIFRNIPCGFLVEESFKSRR